LESLGPDQRLPNARNDAVSYPRHVRAIPAQFLLQHLFLSHRSPRHHCDEDNSPEHSVPGAEQERGAECEKGESRVHGVAHEAIGTRADHGLRPFCLNADGGRQERILAKREKEEPERSQ
jgi:hypothetical protein